MRPSKHKPTILSAWLRGKRTLLRLTQEEMAEKGGVGSRSYQAWELAEAVPDPPDLFKYITEISNLFSPPLIPENEWEYLASGGTEPRSSEKAFPREEPLSVCEWIKAGPSSSSTVDAGDFFRGSEVTRDQLAAGCDIPRVLRHKGEVLTYRDFFQNAVLGSISLARCGRRADDIIIGGAGGAGKTTVLRRIAFDVAQKSERCACIHVASARFGLPPKSLVHDVKFALSRPQTEVVVVFIDDASWDVGAIELAFKEIRFLSLKALFFLSDQSNKLSLFKGAYRLYELGGLLPAEIDDLAKKLKSHRCLGKMDGLSHREVAKRIKTNLDAHAESPAIQPLELLVALRCATEGVDRFESIIQREYNDVLSEQAKTAYRLVSLLEFFELPYLPTTAESVFGSTPTARSQTRAHLNRTIRAELRGYRTRNRVYARFLADYLYHTDNLEGGQLLCDDCHDLLRILVNDAGFSTYTIRRIAVDLIKSPALAQRLKGAPNIQKLFLPLRELEYKVNAEFLISGLARQLATESSSLSFDLLRPLLQCATYPESLGHINCLCAYADLLDPVRDAALLDDAIAHFNKFCLETMAPKPSGMAAISHSLLLQKSGRTIDEIIDFIFECMDAHPVLKKTETLLTFLVSKLKLRGQDGDLDLAVDLIERSLGPETPLASAKNLARAATGILLERDRPQDRARISAIALPIVERANFDPDTFPLAIAMSKAARSSADPALIVRAEARLRRYISSERGCAVLLELTEILEANGKIEDARRMLRERIDLSPSDADRLAMVARLCHLQLLELSSENIAIVRKIIEKHSKILKDTPSQKPLRVFADSLEAKIISHKTAE